MNKLLVHHMRDPDEIAGGGGAGAGKPAVDAKPKVEDPGRYIDSDLDSE